MCSIKDSVKQAGSSQPSSNVECGAKCSCVDCTNFIHDKLGQNGVEGNKNYLTHPTFDSGPTIGVGCDLGTGITKDELKSIPSISKETLDKLSEAIGLRGKEAADFCKEHKGETFPTEDIDKISRWRLKKTIDDTRKQFNAAGGDFDNLSCEQQAVLVSVGHQHGGLKPNWDFTKHAASGDWQGACDDLVSWTGKKLGHENRRDIEASWLEDAGVANRDWTKAVCD